MSQHTETTAGTASVRVTHRFKAGAERVFDAWLAPEVVRQFLFVTPDGTIVRADIDARVGGKYTIVDRRPIAGGGTEDVLHTGTYLEIQRPLRLAFDLSVPHHAEEKTRVEVEIMAQGEGCELTLMHHMGKGKQAKASKDKTVRGWTTVLQNLAKALL